MRIASWVATAIFVLSAAVQWNDPDPLPWMLAYAVAAAVSAAFGLGYPVWIPAAVTAPIFAALAFAVSPEALPGSVSDLLLPEMKTLVIEETRESLGLGLCAIWCGVLAFWGRDGGRS